VRLAAVVTLILSLFGQADDGESVGGRLRGPDDQPVAGVTLTVAQDGDEIGEAETDDDGEWRVPVPEPGTYQVTLDTDTLPEGLGLRDPDRSSLDNVIVRANQQKFVLFPLQAGDGDAGGGRALARIADLAVDGIRLGAIIALAALGLSLIFGVTGLVNFAHGELVAFGALAAWYLNSGNHFGLPLIAAAAVAVMASGGFGAGLEFALWRPLRRRRTGNIALLVVSIGLSLLVRHVYLAFFGGRPRPYGQYAVQSEFSIGPIDLVPKDAVIIVVALVVLGVVGSLFKVTRLGTAMRAVADDRDLAESSGIDVQRVILATWIAGAALAGLGGVFYATTENVSWNMGGLLLLPMFAAVILGGLGTAYGAMAGGLLMGVASEVSTYWIPVEFKVVFALSVLILVLLLRPQGIFGVRERIG
jgi:branched-chain amino acid transport system permease protein